MKKYFAGLVAVSFAVICFAFTTKDFATGPDCINSSYWFHVKNTINRAACNLVTVADFDPILDPNQNGLIDAGELAATTLELKTPADLPYGCEDEATNVCALSFQASQITVVQKAGVYYFEPSSVSTYRCCIKRTNP